METVIGPLGQGKERALETSLVEWKLSKVKFVDAGVGPWKLP